MICRTQPCDVTPPGDLAELTPVTGNAPRWSSGRGSLSDIELPLANRPEGELGLTPRTASRRGPARAVRPARRIVRLHGSGSRALSVRRGCRRRSVWRGSQP